MKNTVSKILVKTLTILTLIIGTATILQANAEIIRTAGQLLILHDNAAYYNEQPRKTDEMTKKYLENNAERQKIYNSEDVVIRVYSNQHAALKIIILVWALASFVFIPYMWFSLIAREAEKLLKYIPPIVRKVRRFVRNLKRNIQRNRNRKITPIKKERSKRGIA